MKNITRYLRNRWTRVHHLLTKSIVPQGFKGDLAIADLLLLGFVALFSGALIDAFHLESYALGILALLLAGIGVYVARKMTPDEDR